MRACAIGGYPIRDELMGDCPVGDYPVGDWSLANLRGTTERRFGEGVRVRCSHLRKKNGENYWYDDHIPCGGG